MKTVLLHIIEGILTAVCWLCITALKVAKAVGDFIGIIIAALVMCWAGLAVYELLIYLQLPALYIMILGFNGIFVCGITLAIWKPKRFWRLFNA